MNQNTIRGMRQVAEVVTATGAVAPTAIDRLRSFKIDIVGIGTDPKVNEAMAKAILKKIESGEV